MGVNAEQFSDGLYWEWGSGSTSTEPMGDFDGEVRRLIIRDNGELGLDLTDIEGDRWSGTLARDSSGWYRGRLKDREDESTFLVADLEIFRGDDHSILLVGEYRNSSHERTSIMLRAYPDK